MPPDEKTIRQKRRKLPGFAAELSRAIDRSGIADADISRATGISRSVLIGYKQGRTVPGGGEIVALCRALAVSPAQLLFGTEQPFKTDPFREALGVSSDTIQEGFLMSQLYGMLIRAEKDAIMMLAKCLVESRQGSQAFDKITKMLKLQHEEMASTVPAIKEAVEPILTPELTAGIERKAKAMFGEPRKSNQRRARRKK